MFASFVDIKILAQCQQIQKNERLAIEQFDRRIEALLLVTDPMSMNERPFLGHLPPSNNPITATYLSTTPENFISDYEVPLPHLPVATECTDANLRPIYNGIFPDLDLNFFETPFLDSARSLDGKDVFDSRVLNSPWKQHSGGASQQKKQRILNVLEVYIFL